MKIYILGCLIIAPVVIGLTADNVIVALLSVVYGAAVWYSPSYIPQSRKFWRAWHRVNFLIINSINLDH